MHTQLQDLSSVQISGQYIYNFLLHNLLCIVYHGGRLGLDQARGYEGSCNYAGICAYMHTTQCKTIRQYIHNFFYIIIFVLYITGIDTIVTEQWRPSWI